MRPAVMAEQVWFAVPFPLFQCAFTHEPMISLSAQTNRRKVQPKKRKIPRFPSRVPPRHFLRTIFSCSSQTMSENILLFLRVLVYVLAVAAASVPLFSWVSLLRSSRTMDIQVSVDLFELVVRCDLSSISSSIEFHLFTILKTWFGPICRPPLRDSHFQSVSQCAW